jgi:hypothetical protein
VEQSSNLRLELSCCPNFRLDVTVIEVVKDGLRCRSLIWGVKGFEPTADLKFAGVQPWGTLDCKQLPNMSPVSCIILVLGILGNFLWVLPTAITWRPPGSFVRRARKLGLGRLR